VAGAGTTGDEAAARSFAGAEDAGPFSVAAEAAVSASRWMGAGGSGEALLRRRGRRWTSAGPIFGSGSDGDSARAIAFVTWLNAEEGPGIAGEADGPIDSARAIASATDSEADTGLSGICDSLSPGVDGSACVIRGADQSWANSTPAPDISWTTDRRRTGPSGRDAAAWRSMPRAASIAAADGPVTIGAAARCRCSVAAMRWAMRANQVSLPNAIGPVGAGSSPASDVSSLFAWGGGAGAAMDRSTSRASGGGAGASFAAR
jgi:hypothetical protein